MSKEILKEFNERISVLLNECSPEMTPTVCNLISTPEGREKVHELIKKKVIIEEITIGEAIVNIEMEYNINSTE